MRTALTILTAVTLSAGSVWAGPDVIIRERAKELRDQNNVRQGVAPPTQPGGAPGQGQAAPGTPVPQLSPTLVSFRTELGALKADSEPSAAQKQKLAQDLRAGAQGAKPSLATVTKLVEDLAAAAVEKPLPDPSRARFVQELDAVLNPAKYPQAKLDGIVADVQAIFQENGLKRSRAVAIADDVKAIAAEIARGGAN